MQKRRGRPKIRKMPRVCYMCWMEISDHKIIKEMSGEIGISMNKAFVNGSLQYLRRLKEIMDIEEKKINE